MDTIFANIINGALVIALMFLIFRRQDKRMDGQDQRISDAVKKIDGQPSKEFCNMQHAAVQEKIKTSDIRVDKLETKLDLLNTTITRVDTNVGILLDRNKQIRKDDK